MPSMRRRDTGRVYRVTEARRGASEDIRRREKRYVLVMLIRTVCLLLAFVVPITPLRIAFVVGAVVLPYFAVVFANGGREPSGSADSLMEETPRIPLPPGTDATDSGPAPPPPRHESMS